MATSPRKSTGSRSSSSPVHVLSVPENIPVTVRFLAGYQGLDTHWRSGRTIPCPGPDECLSSMHKSGIIWKGYAPVEAWEELGRLWVPFVLEVTESLEEQLRGRDLRGEVWTLFRVQKNGRTDPVAGIYCERLAEGKLSPAFDVKPVLLRLFHVSELRLGRANPLPPKIMLEAVAGDAPNLPAELVEMSTPQNDPEKVKAAADLWRAFKERGYRQPGEPDQGSKPADKNGQHEPSKNGR